MSEEIVVCLGCKNKLDRGVPFETFTPSPFIYMCASCQKKLKKKFDIIRNTALERISRNKILNEKFDIFIKDEEFLSNDSIFTSTLFKSSRQLREHMFSLLEEVHRFAYHATFECYMFCDMFENADPYFFSDRYFLTNSVIKTIGAWEKLMRFHCLFFGVKLDRNQKNNILSRLQKKMNKTEFKSTDLYRNYVKLKDNGSFGRIDEARKNNDHNVSNHLNGKGYMELSELAQEILDHTSALYDGIEEALDILKTRVQLANQRFINDFAIVNKIEENDKVFRKKAVKLKRSTIVADIQNINELSVNYMKWAETRLDDVTKWKITYSNPPIIMIYYKLIDVTVRIHESARSLGYSVELFKEAVELNYSDLDRYWVKFDGMNYRYFTHGALIRIYGVYDKLGMIIQDLFEIELGNVTFETVIEHVRLTKGENEFLNSLPPIKKCNRIISSSAYKKLYDSRQDFFHLLVMQDFMNPAYKEVIDTELILAIIENCNMIYDLINSLDLALVGFHRIGKYHFNTKE